MTATPDLAAQLASWARGSLPDEAAVKLLTDTGMLRKVAHLAHESDFDPGRVFLDWEEVTEWFEDDGILSGGEARVIAVALSLAEARPVNLGDAMTGVDHTNARHVLAALAHAAGLDRGMR